MKLFAVPVTLVVATLGLQLLSSQPAEAKGWRHYMRDQIARQQAFYANPAAYNGSCGTMSGYGWQNNFRVNPVRQFSGYGNYPAYQNYGYGYGQGGCR